MGTDQQASLRSSQLAKLAGISADTLRLYERKGLLPRPPRSANGYRCYSPESLQRVRLIRAALAIGFTLNELAEVFRVRDGHGRPCASVRQLAGEKLQNLEAQIHELGILRKELREVLKEWDRALSKTPKDKRAGLLELLAEKARGRKASLALEVYSSLSGRTREKLN